MNRLSEIGAIHIGDEAEGHGAVAIVPERFVGHDRAEVGTADADIDHVADALAGVALPFAAANAIGKRGHLVEDIVHQGNDVFTVHEDGLVTGSAQGDVQHRAFFRDVDFVSAKHGFDPLLQAGFDGQFNQQPDGLIGDAVLGVIQNFSLVSGSRFGFPISSAAGVAMLSPFHLPLTRTSARSAQRHSTDSSGQGSIPVLACCVMVFDRAGACCSA